MWEIVWVFTVGSVMKITNQNMNVLRVVTVFGVQNGIKGFYIKDAIRIELPASL